MTWCLFELCRNPIVMTRLRREIDALYHVLATERRDMQYADLQALPYLSRVIAETLRLWPSVPNGTFREVEFDDVIKGRGGEPVLLRKGTNLNIPVWLLHSSAALWGPTVEMFDPDREWQGEEIWRGQALAAWNPQSPRYMPFTGAPRDWWVASAGRGCVYVGALTPLAASARTLPTWRHA
jgi:cytochrome P450